MRSVLACERHPDRPGTCHDSNTDQVLCDLDFPGEETAHEMEFVLHYVPERLHWAGRPTVEIEEAP